MNTTAAAAAAAACTTTSTSTSTNTNTIWELMDDDRTLAPEHLQGIARRCRKQVVKRALFAAGVAMVPVPGLDWVTDVGLLMKLLPQISAEFGLTPAQIERLAPERQLVVYKAISAGGGLLVGKIVTRDLVFKLVQMVGMRLSAQQAAKYVPLAGQAVSAVPLGTAALVVYLATRAA